MRMYLAWAALCLLVAALTAVGVLNLASGVKTRTVARPVPAAWDGSAGGLARYLHAERYGRATCPAQLGDAVCFAFIGRGVFAFLAVPAQVAPAG
jgi:hypothetical protein